MSLLTAFFNLIKPAKTDGVKVSDFNANMDIIDTEMHKPPLTVNGTFPNQTTRNLYLEKVPLADNLASDIAQLNNGVFVQRTTGGSSSVNTGSAFLQSLKGNMVHTGVVEESINMTVTPMEGSNITATINRETFVAYVTSSGTITLTYSTEWSANPATYGITVTGTPVAGDSITVVYVKANRGTITVATPSVFKATGWNLYNNTDGYARVCAYSTQYGYRIGGSYSLVEFAPNLTDQPETVTVTDGLFNVPEDGFVFVSGGNNTTYIYPTWTTWIDNYVGNFQTYTAYSIDLSETMLLFPYGLMAIGSVQDEINISEKKAYNRIERLDYTAENLASVVDSGVAYDCDNNYIYAVREEVTETDIDLDGDYRANDHGIEFFEGTSVGVDTQILYGENLKDKLRTDVVTLSAQTLTTQQKTQVRNNIGAAAASEFSSLFLFKDYTATYTNLAAGASKVFALSDFTPAIVQPSGYRPIAIKRFSSGSSYVSVAWVNPYYGYGDIMAIYNGSSSAKSGTVTVSYLWAKSAYVSEISS